MTGPDIKLSTDEVRAHAKMVDVAGEMVFEALSAAQYIDMHDEVFGVICSPLFLPIIQPLQTYAVNEINQAGQATQHLADLLESLAHNLKITDEAAARRLGGR